MGPAGCREPGVERSIAQPANRQPHTGALRHEKCEPLWQLQSSRRFAPLREPSHSSLHSPAVSDCQLRTRYHFTVNTGLMRSTGETGIENWTNPDKTLTVLESVSNAANIWISGKLRSVPRFQLPRYPASSTGPQRQSPTGQAGLERRRRTGVLPEYAGTGFGFGRRPHLRARSSPTLPIRSSLKS